jgi:uncharacterized protein YaaN involved in tellurite resistance
MRDLTKQLNQRLEMAQDLDAYLSNAVDNYRAEHGGDDEKTRFLEEEVIFPLRQKVMDFQQLLVVNQQGIVAMEVIRKNNLELIRAVDRAESVTVAALRTAVTVAGALYNQRIVLEPMSRHERKIIHMALQDDPQIATYSEGEEPYRKIVIAVKR